MLKILKKINKYYKHKISCRYYEIIRVYETLLF